MELDKRIIKGKKPLSYFDAERGKEFIGKECYFSDMACKYEDLDTIENTDDRTLYIKDFLKVVDTDCQDRMFKSRELGVNYRYCLPCEWVEEEKKEPKYRPYTIKDFEKAFLNDEFDDFIIFRDKHDHGNVYTMRYNGNYTRGKYEYICLGAKNYSFESLFENYEVANYDGDFVPFGVLEE